MALDHNQVGWFEIPVTDMKRAIGFYQHLFGVQLEEHAMGPAQMAWFPMKENETGSAGSLVQGPGYTPSTDGVLIYFTVANIEDACERATTGGGRVLQEKLNIGEYGFLALLQDTEGNKIGIHTRA
jgi:predicted enzyme related to lactoylglutathione lyase